MGASMRPADHAALRSRAATRVLITGFGRFPGAPVNPSGPLAHALAASRRLHGAQVRAMVLPTTWEQAARFGELLDSYDPDVVLMLGLAARRRHVSVELFGRAATRLSPDANRNRPASRRLVPEGPDLIAGTAPAAPLLHALRHAHLRARTSRDAGGYICNALAYTAYGWASTAERRRTVVFVHIPRPRPGRVRMAALTRGMEALLVALVQQHRRALRAA